MKRQRAPTLALPRDAGEEIGFQSGEMAEGACEIAVSIPNWCTYAQAPHAPEAERSTGFGSRWLALLALIPLLCATVVHADSTMKDAVVLVPGGTFETVLPPDDATKRVSVQVFRLDTHPVTNAQFAAFVAKHPQWQRDRVARVFADEQYLQHWTSATQPAAKDANKPVVHVSWFAASAYCEARGGRLPTWHEWEYVAAASTTQRDARSDPQWRQEILEWYSKSARGELPNVGATPANVYGVRDVHGVVWEWIEDLPALLVANDSREQGDPAKMRFCGAGAVSMEQKENYAMLMRIAMLSSMRARYSSSTMGFRCAYSAPPTG